MAKKTKKITKPVKIKKSEGSEHVEGKKKLKFPSPFRLDLACGTRKDEGYFGIDIIKTPQVDMVWDLEKYPWPIPDNCVDEAICFHYLEHVKDIMKFMNEVYRILKTGSKITIIAPYYNSMRAWQDPTHIRVISENTFLYYNKQWRVDNHVDHYPIKADFDFSFGYLFTADWANRAEEARAFALRHYTNVADDIQVVLTKKESV